ncbi:MAG: Ig-like domain-containing protein [Terriglobales bacterium]
MKPSGSPWLLAVALLALWPVSNAAAQTLNPTSLTFASQVVGTTSGSKVVTLTNSPAAAITISSISASGDFGQTNNCPIAPNTLAPGAKCQISVTFTPTLLGTRNGTLTVIDNASNSPQTAALTGSGVAPAVLVPNVLTFANQVVNTTSTAQVITVGNYQTVALIITSISISGDFAQASTCPLSPAALAARSSCTISVMFTPTALGARTGTLTVNDNASNSPQTAQLGGTGIAPVLLQPNSLAFGNQFVDTSSAAKVITVGNYQTVPLTIASISASTNFAPTSNCPLSPSALAALSSCTISVIFTPTAAGALSGLVTVNDNASNTPQIATLTGNGVLPVILSPTSLTFPNQIITTTSKPQSVTLKNNQSVALTISALSTTGDFAQTANCPLSPNTLAAGATCTISATFTPTAPGSRLGTLSIADNASTSPQSVGLSGIGTMTGLVSISVTPANPSLPAGEQQQLTATGRWVNGQTLNITNFVTWSSSAPAIAQVNSTGLLQAIAAGTTTITASYGSVSGPAAVTVASPVLSSIAVTPANPSVPVGAYQQFTAILTYSNGSTRDATSEVTWSSSASAVAGINSSGLATASSQGSSTITASWGSVMGSTTLTVSQPQCAVPPAGLTGWWTGDGNAVDIAGSNSGTLQSGAGYGTGEVAQAFTFGGNGASVLVNSPVYSPPAGTVMFWFLSTGGGTITGSYPGGQNRAPGFSIDSGGNLDWEFGNLSAQSVGLISPNQWYQAALTYSTSNSAVNISVYLNGTLVAGAIASANTGWNPQLAIGAYLGAQRSSFVGSVDEFTIFNQALTSQQIQQIYDTFSAGMCKPTLQQITVNPADPTLGPGASLQFSAAGTYSDTTTHDLTSSATWTSSNPAAATLSGAGLATGVAPGNTTIAAALQNQNGSTTLSVGPSLVSVQVNPAAPTIAEGTSQAFAATGTYSDGSKQNLTASAVWTSSLPAVATIVSDGLVSGVTPGQATITATAGGFNGNALLTVTSATLSSIAVNPPSPSVAAGATQQFTATGTFSDSSMQDLTTQVSWTSSAPLVATVNANGLAASIAAGQSTITATFGSVSNFATLNVNSAVLTSIAVAPVNPSILVGGTQPFTATGTFSDNSQQNLTGTVTWASSNQVVATISPTGLATGLSLGPTTISASLNSIAGSTTLNVTPTLLSISVSPANAAISAGLSQAFTAQGTFSDGSQQYLTSSVQWSSSTPAVATVSNTPGTNGIATATSSGTTLITATSGAVNGSANLTVTTAVLAAIAVSPASPSITPGGTAQFAATGIFTDGSSANVTSNVTWGSSNSTVATISNTTGSQGLATVTGAGTTEISATSSLLQGSTTLTGYDPLVSISVTPSNALIVPGNNQQFTATGTYASGLQGNLTNVLWTSSNPAVATMSSSGLAMSLETGQTTISASAGPVSGLAALGVTPIQHVVVIFQENRTPDNLFQGLPGADIASSGINSKGQVVPLAPEHLENNYDMSHSHAAFLTEYDNGKMDRFDKDTAACAPQPCTLPANPEYFSVYPSDVVPYLQLAGQYTFGDRMFQTQQGPSFPAHQFIISGTSAPSTGSDLYAAENPTPVNEPVGCTGDANVTVALIDPTGNESQTQFPCFEHATLTDLLDAQNISWRYYTTGISGIWTGPNAIEHMRSGPDWSNVVSPSTQVLTDIANGQLAAVSWVIPDGQESDHAGINDGSGPSWVASVVNAVGNSPYWANTAIFITWDDWGGWYDHVPPSSIINSYEYGFRVPLIVVSPFAKSAYVSHVNHDFGSILKFIEETYNLPSLGYADALADDLSDCFNFGQLPMTFQKIKAPLGPEHFLHDTRPPLPPDDD